jgi:ribonuclease P protein subunit RPR2
MDIRRKKIIKSSVRSSIEKLLDTARKSFDSGNEKRSERYVVMAFDLLKKHKIKLPKELRNSFCRKCMAIWVPGRTVTVSYDKKRDYLKVTCRCGFSKRL